MAFFEAVKEMFFTPEYAFLRKTMLVGLLVSLCAALLGVSLVLKRYSMIGEGLSHVGFGALAVATALNAAPLTVSIPVVVLAAFLLLRLSSNSKLKGDAAIALISTSALAIGVATVSLTTGMNTDVCNYLFGSILTIKTGELWLTVALAPAVLLLFTLFYHKIFAVTFDESFAKATGVKTGAFNMLIALLTAVVIVLGLRVMGALLISSLIIFPALSSMRVFKTFRSVTLCAAAISVLCFFVGVVLSYMAPRGLPTGASVVLVNVAVFLLFWLAGHLPRRSRKKAATALMMLVILVTLPGCGGTNTTADTITGANTPSYATAAGKNIPSITRKPHAPRTVEVKEKLFLTQMNEILANVEDYLGDTIQLEGMFTVYAAENGTTYYSVYRNSPGCCGSDGQTGFEVHWKKTQHPAYPKENDWVRAVGVLEDYDEDGSTYLRLALTSLTVQSKRGTEFVEQ